MYTYFAGIGLRATEDQIYCKIGSTSAEPKQRLAQLQTGNPFGLVLLAHIADEYDFEGFLHRWFAKQRLSGEWFALSARDISWITNEIEDRRAASYVEVDLSPFWWLDEGGCPVAFRESVWLFTSPDRLVINGGWQRGRHTGAREI